MALFGNSVFMRHPPSLDGKPGLMAANTTISVLHVILGIWNTVLLCHTVAEVQGFRSAWRGLGNLALSFLVAFIPILIVVLFFAFLFSRF